MTDTKLNENPKHTMEPDKNVVVGNQGAAWQAELIQVKQDMENLRQINDIKLKSLEEKMDQNFSKIPTLRQIAGIVFGGLALLVAIFAYAGDRFDGGLGYGIGVGEKYAENKIEIEKTKEKQNEIEKEILEVLRELRKAKNSDNNQK